MKAKFDFQNPVNEINKKIDSETAKLDCLYPKGISFASVIESELSVPI